MVLSPTEKHLISRERRQIRPLRLRRPQQLLCGSNQERASGRFPEVGNYTPVVELQARAVSIEDAQDTRIHAAIAMVRHGHSFSEALGFVIHGARTNRIHVPPVRLFLWMQQGIAVTL